ncbi:predicted protein [Chaetomium globosum CBS 148.51]|uniref:Uncharacterized protein n=1 Tax=Chaetomium globosum (strain ATCC 6205 / CBS 148.51 / DSM 1962 / NBRC 6347 / NRRL 1970) TaxID=306901 RepID=Q2GVJ3_CHAGB|nr:uncharacterized protein CHGG_08011 [Chaetomium globosum CBS 148.51]EAQ86758.1 predicted protein [Chaetomium globosum CBS 148.51]
MEPPTNTNPRAQTMPPPPPESEPATSDGGRPTQRWTVDGYPIVDGKYLDHSTGELKTHVAGVDQFRGGPPSVSVYWQNQLATGRGGQFLVVAKVVTHVRDLTEYLTRVGTFLGKGLCKVHSLNATRYEVYVVVSSELSQGGFREALAKDGLLQ